MIVITGGSGYLGSHIAKKLIEFKFPIRVMVRSIDKALHESRFCDHPIDFLEGDITQPSTLPLIFEGAHTIIHTVGIAIENGSKTYEAVNTTGTANVVSAAKTAGIRHFINISQLGADPQLPYRFLASKGKAQEFVASSDLNWTTFKPSVIWGPEDEFANTFARLIPLSPFIFPIIDKNARFQPVWVDDVAISVIKSLDDHSTYHKEFELGGPEILSLFEIERRTLRAVGAKRILIPFPRPLLNIVVSLMEAFIPSPPVTQSLLELLKIDNVTNENAISYFIANPKPFKPENTAPYMTKFKVKDTIAQLFGKYGYN